jgi:hypothetical protein
VLDHADTQDPGGDMGGCPIGSDCLRKHPEFKPYTLSEQD